MQIQKIEIENFRGIDRKREFLFESKSFVMLAAPNGLGKTTLIDAIEWCLTGSISRLKNAFDTRSTNEEERKKNVEGILKNKKANENDIISVILSFMDNDKTYTIKRSQYKDELNVKLSQVCMNDSEEQAAQLLPQMVDHNFYNFHFCDVQKSIGVQSYKRKDLPDMFSEFITDYTREINVADNLDLFADDAIRYYKDLEEQMKEVEINIKAKQEVLKGYDNTPAIQNYPDIQLYEGENILIAKLDERMLNNQLAMLYKCGYKQVDTFLAQILHDDSARNTNKDLTELLNILKAKKKIIDQAIEQKLHIGTENIISLVTRIQMYKKMSLAKENIWSYSNTIMALNSCTFTESRWNESKTAIRELEINIKEIKSEIETLSKGNDILDSLSSLLSKQQGLKKYREEKQQNAEKVNCPVCGSERFGKIEEAELLSTAREYIDEHGLLLTEKKRNKDQLENQIQSLYEALIKSCNEFLADDIKQEEKKKEELIKLQEETKDFFIVVRRLEQIDSIKYALEQLVKPEYVNEIKLKLEEGFLSAEEIWEKRGDYKKILVLLEYIGSENESEKILAQKIHELAKNAPSEINFSHSLLVDKISSINSLLNNKKYLELKNELEVANKQNDDFKNQQIELNIISKQAKQHAGFIRNLVNELKADEYNKVGPNLFKYYKKLSRINTIDSIQIKQDSESLSMVDERDKNIVNILSNGQLSVFMLAYFFAGIVSRNKQELCKIYFIDDLTACMDDVNMLAFLDLMKYHLLERNGAMDQIFFASCDERICKLLRYKLSGCGVDFCELIEKDFA